MRLDRWKLGLALLAGLCVLTACQPRQAADQPTKDLPHFVEQNGRHAFMVDGEPFLILGAQANNSSNYPSALGSVWPAVEQMHANTLEIPVAWEQVEPVEGQFDWSYVDELVKQAREHDVRLVLLWFATWKNTSPNYAPSWVKLDNARFPRLTNREGKVHYALSPHGEETLKADSRAFAALMQRLREIDGDRQTVIMVQVQNEAGTYGSPRDYGPAAEALFNAAVPAELVQALGKRAGTWAEVFGRDADVSFHAWHIASYIEQVAAAGKAQYALPMYVNAALADPLNYQDPSSYSSGGPTHNVIDIYKAAAPSISVLAPDIYSREHRSVTASMAHYTRPDNPLMIVEIGNDESFARYFFHVLGQGGVGFAPFGMDYTGYYNYPLGAKAVDDKTIQHFGRMYEVLAPMARDWARIAFERRTWGVAKPDDGGPQTIDLGRWRARVTYDQWMFGQADWTWLGPLDPSPNTRTKAGGVTIAELGENDYLLIAQNARVTFSLTDPAAANGMIYDRVEEGRFVNGEWVMDRNWNGDQTDYGLNFSEQPRVLRVKLGTY